MTRREARERVFQFLYQIQIQQDEMTLQLEEFLKTCEAEGCEEASLQYIRATVMGVCKQEQDWDSVISAHLRGWTLNRLPKVDRAILRLAVFELKQGEIPSSVAIHEAVLLARKFSTEEARVFINGLLARVASSSEEGAQDGSRSVADT